MHLVTSQPGAPALPRLCPPVRGGAGGGVAGVCSTALGLGQAACGGTMLALACGLMSLTCCLYPPVRTLLLPGSLRFAHSRLARPWP